MRPLPELQSLAKSHDGKLTLEVTRDCVRATWKAPGSAVEVVTERNHLTHPEHTLNELLVRLGYKKYPTIAEALARMTPNQRARVHELAKAIRACPHCLDKQTEIIAIKYEALTPIEEHIPELAAGSHPIAMQEIAKRGAE